MSCATYPYALILGPIKDFSGMALSCQRSKQEKEAAETTECWSPVRITATALPVCPAVEVAGWLVALMAAAEAKPQRQPSSQEVGLLWEQNDSEECQRWSWTVTPAEEVEPLEQQPPVTEAAVAQNGEGAVEVGS